MQPEREPPPVKQVFLGYHAADTVPTLPAHCVACGGPLLWEADATVSRCVICGHRTYRNPYPGVSILVTSGTRFLLGRRRARSFLGGQWCLPCGYVEHPEDFLEAARREVLEETGVPVAIRSILTVSSNFLSPDLHSLVITLLAEPFEPAPALVPGDDVEHVEWFDASQPLPPMAFEGDTHIIRRYFAAPFPGAPVQDPLSDPRE